LIPALVVLSGCSYLPFEIPAQLIPAAAPAPAPAPQPMQNIVSEYKCAGGKKLYVRYRHDDTQAWILLPDREILLNKIASQVSSRFTDGVAILDAKGTEATYSSGTGIAYTECKR
jgi:membrane-bound inhibitor of C-type lysozyme